jgi:membrane fusion protein (multidrug efflux system)
MRSHNMIRNTLFIAVFGVLLAACGGQEKPRTLEGKKKLLQSKKAELLTLNKEIEDLQAEIIALDPKAKNQVKTIPVSTTTLRPGNFQHFVKVQGTVESNKNVMVSPQAGGRITRIFVREGQSVKRGQILAQIDDAVMKSSIDEVKTQLELATIMFDKQQRLWDQEIGTEVQYLTAKSQKESLQRRLKTLGDQLAMSKIKSPINGTVDEIMAKTGETAMPGMPAMRIVSPSDLSLTAQLAESYVPYIRKGDKVKINFPTLDKNLEAQVSFVGQAIDPLARTFRVEVKLPNDPVLKTNMFGEISINDRTVDEAITIPQSLIQKSEEGEFVFVAEQKDGQWVAVRRNIQSGLSYDGIVEVTEGLAENEKLISTGYKGLSNGQPITFDEAIAVNQ